MGGIQLQESTAAPAALARIRALAVVLIALPAILFYGILFGHLLNLPLYDDYESLLEFLNQMATRRAGMGKVSYLLASQHNEYKLFFEHVLIWLQVALFGHIDFRVLCAIGDGFVFLLAILLWNMFIPGHKDLFTRLIFFIPVTWLLFQLQYIETLNWAMASLQNLPVLVFSLTAIHFLIRGTRLAFLTALVALVFAIASSGNGMLMVPIGTLILARRRHYCRTAGWLAVSTGCLAAYAFNFNLASSQSPTHHSIFAAASQISPLFVISFLGNAASFPIHGALLSIGGVVCPLLGLILLVFWVYMAQRRYWRKNSEVSYCVLFLLLTSIAVAALRSDLGISHSLWSRYGMYSILFVIFTWYAIVDESVQPQHGAAKRFSWAAVTAAVLFSLVMDIGGLHYIVDRNATLIHGMTEYENGRSGPVLPLPNQPKRFDELDRKAPLILKESTRLGIYRPPDLLGSQR